MKPQIDHKAGATFELDCTLEFDGAPVDISGWDIRSEIRDRSNALIATPSATITDGPKGRFKLYKGDTGDWSPGTLVTDIRYAFNGKDLYSETVYIRVLDAVTEEP